MNYHFPPIIQRWFKFTVACHGVFFVLIFAAIHLTRGLSPPYVNTLSPFASLNDAPVSTISDCADYRQMGDCVDLHGGPSQDFRSKLFYGVAHPQAEGIREVYVTGYAGRITKLVFRLEGLELADVVHLWQRPDDITKTKDSSFLLHWDEGVDVTTHPDNHFDYHTLIETLTYIPE